MFMGEEGKKTGLFEHLVISSGVTDHRADPLILNFNGMARFYLKCKCLTLSFFDCNVSA